MSRRNTPRQRWTGEQTSLIVLGAFLVLGGKSIYFVVRWLKSEPLLQHRSLESIRSKLNRIRRRDAAHDDQALTGSQ